ncbi:chitobiase/beta-hexosaminidase C-terminal domain-containing protein [Niabella sp. CC-SYL272]|uniref:FN3 associated domain-containing protein n=1 Tax=Niabella agricola TaxID=2891571 RepID=UPI001F2F5716|nr:FN3 associated domain-containing protein [Niabella agricola]MCF3108311.1 chitobiase/beta-hexosaminidase C-terminal domain-containing protein [Niabella agricola]
MKQLKWREIIFNACIALNGLLLILVIFDRYLKIPAVLQVAGRAHPLVLHFPIVLLLLAFLFEMQLRAPRHAALQQLADGLLLAASFTTVVAALMGILLSKETGYDPAAIGVHKWMGVLSAFISFLWYSFRNQIRAHSSRVIAAGLLSTTVLLIAGHQGATITHGDNFLLSPVISADKGPEVPLEAAVIYTHLVQPILKNKCMSCHNSNKAKGELVMETTRLLLKGGKNGKLWDTAAADLGLMMQRIHLPPESKEHMPPRGKPQLTEEEARILYLWIKGGAHLTKKVTDLPGNDTLRMIAARLFKSGEPEDYDFKAAAEQLVAELNTTYRVITPLSQGSPALAVNFYGSSRFHSAQLKELEKIKDNIVSLQLAKMPVTDADLKTIGTFAHLRTLNLAFTAVKGDGLRHLSSLQYLKQLSLSGTGVRPAQLSALAPLKDLRSVQVWNTAFTAQDLAALKNRFPKTDFDLGYKGDTVIAKLSTPVLKTEQRIFKNTLTIEIKNPVKGAETRYTLDGSEPDSLRSPVYTAPVTLHKAATLKARSYLAGWITSDPANETFYKSSIQPDSIRLITPPSKEYLARARNGKALIDGQLGKENPGTREWVGYREAPFEALLFFKAPVTISTVTFSSLVAIDSYVMPAHELQVWGGPAVESLKLLGHSEPRQPAAPAPAYTTGYECRFTPQPVHVIKLIAKPVNRLPSWHRGKGDKGWIFLDELLLN